MAAPYVTAAEILTAAGNSSPTADETAWAGQCAAAVEAVIADRLDTDNVTLSAGQEAELQAAAVLDGAAYYASRNAPHGVLSIGPDGDAIRLGASIVRALEPIFLRYAGPGIG